MVDEEWKPTHPAEKAAMYKTNSESGNSDDVILRHLRKSVFSVPLLPQNKIHEVFLEIDKQLTYGLVLVLLSSDFYLNSIVQTIVRVTAGNTYGKNIYEHDAVVSVPGKPTYKKHEIEFLARAYQFLLAANSNREDPEKIQKAIQQCGFIRGIMEETLESYTKQLVDYRQLHWSALKAKMKNDLVGYSKIAQKIERIDKEMGLKTLSFGACDKCNKIFKHYLTQRSNIIAPYLRSVYRSARSTAKNTQQMLDNFQNGAIGLVRAVSCYSTKRPTSFSSVAKWWIKQSLLLAIKEDANFVRLPVSTWQTYTQLERARAKLGGDEDTAKIALASNMSEKKVKSVYNTIRVSQVYSIHKSYNTEEKLTLEDVIATEIPEVSSESLTVIIREYCHKAKFTPKERLILALRFGMPDMINEHKYSEQMAIREALIQNLANIGFYYTFNKDLTTDT